MFLKFIYPCYYKHETCMEILKMLVFKLCHYLLTSYFLVGEEDVRRRNFQCGKMWCVIYCPVFGYLQGFLVSVCSDDTLHLWTLKQKVPEVVHSLTFKRERYSGCTVEITPFCTVLFNFTYFLVLFHKILGCLGKRVQRRSTWSLAFVDSSSKTARNCSFPQIPERKVVDAQWGTIYFC